jgi:hypothetical protein
MLDKAPTPAELAVIFASRKSKYGVKMDAKGREDRTWDNIVFDSKREMLVYRDHVKQNIVCGIYRVNPELWFQVPYELCVARIDGTLVCIGKYVADFVVMDTRGQIVVIDAKGAATPLYKWKKKHFEAQYGMRITEL